VGWTRKYEDILPTPFIYSYDVLVDYILFFTGDVDVTMNPNEIRDYKYVSKDELQAMFDAPGVWSFT
jgi:isopentenyldiphosphate isomerase